MKISNSKKQLAKIIHENGGWSGDAGWAAQDKRHCGQSNVISFYEDAKPWFNGGDFWRGNGVHDARVLAGALVPNWHQTILSRDEYFHLYPAPDADVGSLSAALALVTDENKHEHVDSKPTIEQLAADYRNAQDYADRKQREADAAKADADAKLAELVAAGRALGLVLSAAGVEPVLAVTDWRDLQLGDIIEYVDGDIKDKIGMSGPVVEFAPAATDGMHVRLKCDNGPNKGRLGWPRKWRFISRPAKGDHNA